MSVLVESCAALKKPTEHGLLRSLAQHSTRPTCG
jgi:hypothetical protein